MKRILLSWSGGKDSAWALHLIRQVGEYEVVGLLTTLNAAYSRVAMHGFRETLLDRQAEEIGLPLWKVPLPWPCSNEEYEKRMAALCKRAVSEGIFGIAFGDLFLEDIRTYRIDRMRGTGLEPLFPVWGIPTALLAGQMMDGGLRARITCLDPTKIDANFAGRDWSKELLAELPLSADPCGENGEFHTFVYDGPIFRKPIQVMHTQTVERDGFIFAELAEVDAPGAE